MVSLQDAIKSHIDLELSEVYTCTPGKITAIKVVGNSTVVDVQILLNKIDKQSRSQQYQTIEDLPLQWPQSGGCYITTPIEVGDNVMVYFTMSNASVWKNGDGVTPQTPRNKRRHSLNDGFACPAVLPYGLGHIVDTEAVRMSSGATEIRILKDGTIEFGEGAVEKMILGTSFQTWINTLITTKIALHQHVSAAPGVVTSTPVDASSAPMIFETMPDTALSEVVKTK